MISNIRQPILKLLIVSIFLPGCYITEKTYGVAHMYRRKNDYFEIQIPYRIKGRGSLHNFTFEKFEDSSSSYIVFFFNQIPAGFP